MAKVRVPVIGTVGKSVLINTDGNGATIGKDLRMPDGTIATAASLAAYFNLRNNPTTVINQGGGLNVATANNLYIRRDGALAATGPIKFDATVLIKERISANPDIAGYGQLWVKNDIPNTLWFTDDAGNDLQIGSGLYNIVEDLTPQLGGDLDGNGASINMTGGGVLRVYDSSDDDYVSLHHNGSDTYLDGVNLGDLVATGFDAIDFGNVANVNAGSFGGVAKANLLDKTAAETVSGEYTFTALTRMEQHLRMLLGTHISFYDSTNSEIVGVYNDDTNLVMEFAGGTAALSLEGGDLLVDGYGDFAQDVYVGGGVYLDGGDDASIYVSAASPDALVISASSADAIQFFPGGETPGADQATLSLASQSAIFDGRVDIENGNVLRVYDAADSFYATYAKTAVFTTDDSWQVYVGGTSRFDFQDDRAVANVPLYLVEQAAAATDTAAQGQIWVKNDTPNTLWFTDDAGTDFQLGVGGGLADVVDDTSPQLGGDLDVNGNDITGLDTLTLTSTGDVALYLKADTDNSGEDGNPFIRFEQDGNLVNGVIGLTGATSVDAQGNTFTNAGNNGISIHSFSDGGTAGNIALGCEGAVALAITSDNAAEFFSTAAFSSASPLIASGKSSLSSTQLYLDGKKAFRSVGTWLYMNDGGDFSSGMYTPGIVRADGGLNAGNGDFTASNTGDVYSDRQYTGGFGAMTTGGTTDFNHSTNARSGMGYTLLRGSDTNGPGAGLNVSTSNYNHILNFEYGSKTGSGNLLQYALPYTNGDAQGIRQRTRFSSTWGSWVEYLHTGNGGLHYAAAETFSSSKVTVGTGAASGGSDGDIHYRY